VIALQALSPRFLDFATQGKPQLGDRVEVLLARWVWGLEQSAGKCFRLLALTHAGRKLMLLTRAGDEINFH
jgi:hypothetical protein